MQFSIKVGDLLFPWSMSTLKFIRWVRVTGLVDIRARIGAQAHA